MIKLVVFDLDGVITDGTILIDAQGNEFKRLNMKDIDAIFELKAKGYLLGAITGEEKEIVDFFEARFSWDFFYKGIKEKSKALREIEVTSGIDMKNICYIGDGKYDIAPIKDAGLGVCPFDAIDRAKEVADVVLSQKAGTGGIWELIDVLERQKETPTFFHNRINSHMDVFRKMYLDTNLLQQVEQLCDITLKTLREGHRVFLFGNGGSASDAQHIAAEFVGRFYKERQAFNVEALTTNTSILTAIGNDYGFEAIFKRQVEAKATAKDLLIGLSTSGTSSNVLEALKFGQNSGMRTAMLTGNKGASDQFIDNIEVQLCVPSQDTPRIQEMHIFIGHMLAEYVENKWQEK